MEDTKAGRGLTWKKTFSRGRRRDKTGNRDKSQCNSYMFKTAKIKQKYFKIELSQYEKAEDTDDKVFLWC